MNGIFLVVMTVLTVTSITLLIGGLIKDDTDTIGGSLALLLLVIIGGWVFFGLVPTYSAKTDILQPNPSKICRNSDNVLIQIDDQILKSDSYKFYTASNDCIRVKRVVGFNAYGLETIRTYSIEMKE